jgi:hypothetical protein
VLDRKLKLPRHDTVDAEDHDVVSHELSEPSMTAVCVTEYPPKLRPDIVTDKTPDIAVFAFSAFDRDGASKLNALNRVPTIAPTVMIGETLAPGACASPAEHRTIDDAVQLVVRHIFLSTSPRADVGV